MKKYDPIIEFSKRLNYLILNDIIDLETVFQFDYIELKENLFNSCDTTNKKNEFKIKYETDIKNSLIFLISGLETILIKIRKAYPVSHPCFNLNVISGGEKLSINEYENIKEHLEKEIENYILIVEVILNEKINHLKPEKPLVKDKKKAGRKKLLSRFRGDKVFTDEQIDLLYNFIFIGRNYDELFVVDTHSQKIFKEIMRTDDLIAFSNEGHKITISCENYLFAYVLTWLEKNGFLKSPFLAIGNSKSFYTQNNKLLNKNDLAKAKSNYSFETYITSSPSNEKTETLLTDLFPLNPEENNLYFPYLNNLLHATFSV